MNRMFVLQVVGMFGCLMIGVLIASATEGPIVVAAQPEPKQTMSQSAPSPYMSSGPCELYLKAVHDGTDDDAMRQERRQSALVLLASSESTIEYLGVGLQYDLDETLIELIEADLRTSAFADMYCVPGERCIVEACLKRAGRFGAVSIPALWRLVNEQQKEAMIKDRFRTHGLDVLANIYRSSSDKTEIRKRLKGQPDGAAIIEHLSCLDPVPATSQGEQGGK